MENREPQAWKDWLVSAKLQLPTLSGSIARREVLRDIDAQILPYRLTLAHGPAGYGKTTLLAQWAHAVVARGGAALWLSLDEDDRALGHFIAYLAYALDFGLGHGLDRPQRPGGLGEFYERPLAGGDLTRFKAAAVRALGAVSETLAGPLVLFLDDYHRAETPDLDALVDFLVGAMPDGVHLVLASRMRPGLPLGSYMARGILNEITMSALAFSPAEVEAFLGASRANYDVRLLEERFEGWPAGLQLARVWQARAPGRPLDPEAASGRSVDLARYLAEEVFQSLPAEVQDFLLATAVLERFNGELANAVTGGDDGWAMIETIERQNLFLKPLDGSGQWFRYHPVFAEFLVEKLRRRGGGQKAEYNRRAAEWFARASLPREALAQAQATGDIGYLAAMLERFGGWRLMMRLGSKILGAVDAQVATDVLRYPSLALGTVYRLAQDGKVAEARRLIERLEAAIETPGALAPAITPGLALDIRILVLVLRLYEDEIPSLDDLDVLERALDSLPEPNPIARALLQNLQCFVLHLVSRYGDCISAGERAVSGCRALDMYYAENYLYFFIGIAHFALGRLDAAEACYRRARQRITDSIAPESVQGPENAQGSESAHYHLIMVFMAEVLYERDRIDDADRLLRQSLAPACRSEPWVELMACGYLTRALIDYTRQGARAALATLEEGRIVADDRKFARLRTLLLAREVAFLARSGAFVEASALRNSHEYRAALAFPAPGEITSWQTADYVARALCFLALAERDLAGANEICGRLDDYAAATGNMRARIVADLLRGVCARAAGDRRRAAQAVVAAVETGYPLGFRRLFLDFGRAFSLLAADALDLAPMLAAPTAAALAALMERVEEEAGPDERPFFLALAEDEDSGGLSAREQEIARLVAEGLSSKEIARRLDLAEGTVKTYRKRIHKKLGAATRSEMIAKARAQGVIS